MTRRAAAGQRRAARDPRVAVRGPSILADVLLFVSAGCVSMAATAAAYSTFDDDIVLGEVGRRLLLLFAGALVVAGVMLGGLGVMLLHSARNAAESYALPVALGLVGGGVEAVLLLDSQGDWMWVPALLLIPAFRPVRRLLLAPFGVKR